MQTLLHIVFYITFFVYSYLYSYFSSSSTNNSSSLAKVCGAEANSLTFQITMGSALFSLVVQIAVGCGLDFIGKKKLLSKSDVKFACSSNE